MLNKPALNATTAYIPPRKRFIAAGRSAATTSQFQACTSCIDAQLQVDEMGNAAGTPKVKYGCTVQNDGLLGMFWVSNGLKRATVETNGCCVTSPYVQLCSGR